MKKTSKTTKSCCGRCCHSLTDELTAEAKSLGKKAVKTAKELKSKYDAESPATKKKIKQGVTIAAAGLAGLALAKKALSKKK